VKDQEVKCNWLDLRTGVKEECNKLGFLFLIVVDWVMRKTVGRGENGVRRREEEEDLKIIRRKTKVQY